MKSRLLKVIVGFLLCTTPIWALAQTPGEQADPPAPILDFEAEVIEGQRKSPQLFLQMDVAAPDLDTVMYLRQNFNDFQSVEKNRKPLYRRTRN